MTDGKLQFDTAIKEDGFNKGMERITKKAKRATKEIADQGKDTSDEVGENADDAAEEVERAAEKSAEKTKKAASEVEKAAKKAGETAKKESEETRRSTEQDAEDLAGKMKDLTGKIAAATAGLGIANAVKDAVTATAETAAQLGNAMNQLAAATGSGTVELEAYQDVMLEIYKNNYGETFDDIGNAISVIVRNLGEMDASTLQELTESAFALQDVFGYEMEESVRAAKAMMDQFGISGDEAMNLIANGAQNGLDYSGELIDSISEYSVHFAKIGLSADDMFQVFESGAKSGAWNLDKIGDAVKEFTIRAIDGSDTTKAGFDAVGVSADLMAEKFASGGEDAREAFKQVIEGLAQMEDPVQQGIAGVNLFGTMWEDLGPEVVMQLAQITDQAYGASDALEKIKEVRYDDVASSVATLGRTVMAELIEPIADVALPAIKDVIDDMTEALDPPKTILQEVGDTIKDVSKSVKNLSVNLENGLEDAAAQAKEINAYKEILLSAYDQEGASEEELAFKKEQTRLAVERLSGTIPALAAAFNAESGSIEMTRNELEKLLDDSAKLAEYNALENVKAQSDAALIDAEVNLQIAKGMRQDAEEARKSAARDYAATQKESGQASNYLTGETKKQTEAEKELQRSMEKSAASEKESIKAEEEAQKAYDLAAQKNKILTEKLEESEEALGGEAEAAQKAADANKQVASSAEKGASGAEVQETALDTLQSKYSEFREQLEQDIQSKISLFDTFDGGEDQTVEQMLSNLQKQKEGLQNWKSNMEKLASEVGSTITPEFYNAILEMGTEGANAVQHMVKTLDQQNGRELLKQMSDDWASTLDMSDSVAEGIANTVNQIQENGEQLKEAGVQVGQELIEETAGSIADSSAQVETAAMESGENVGTAMQEAEAEAMQKQADKVSSATEGNLQKSEDAALGYYDNFYQVGSNLMKGLSVGMDSRSAEVARIAREAVKKAVDAAKKEGDIRSPSHVMRDEVGVMLARGMAEGMDNGRGAIEGSAKELSAVAVETAKKELDIHSPSGVFEKKIGKNIVQGTIKGIKGEKKKLQNVIKKTTSDALKAAKAVTAEDGNYTETASAILDSYSDTLSKRQAVFLKQMEKKLDKYTDDAVEKYEKKADKTKNKKKKKEYENAAKNIQSFANTYNTAFLSALESGLETEYEKIQESLSKKLDAIADKYQSSYDSIISLREDMRKKMAEPVNLYDMDTQLTQVERYQNGLKSLKDKVPESLMEQILGMNMNEADNFMDYLNQMTEEELEAYKKKWNDLQDTSEDYSENFFSGKLEKINQDWRSEIEKVTKSAQEQMKSVGNSIAQGLLEGIEDEMETMDKKSRKIAKRMIKSFKKAFDIHSPSHLMEKEVGRFLPPGISKGFEKGMPEVTRKITDVVEVAIAQMQSRLEGMEYRMPGTLQNISTAMPEVNITNSQPLELQAQIQTKVELDGRTVGKAITPYVNRYMYDAQRLERRGS